MTAPTLAEAQAAGFLVGAEPLALDLADTLITVFDPPTDLLADDGRLGLFWALQKLACPTDPRRLTWLPRAPCGRRFARCWRLGWATASSRPKR